MGDSWLGAWLCGVILGQFKSAANVRNQVGAADGLMSSIPCLTAELKSGRAVHSPIEPAQLETEREVGHAIKESVELISEVPIDTHEGRR